MNIVSLSAIKGGVGKTTISFNFGEWLGQQGKRVLFIDLDHQCNLSQAYNVYDQTSTVGNIFSGLGKVEIHSVSDNIDLIAGDMKLDDIERSIESNTNKNMMLYMWLSDNYEYNHIDKYDYIIIDCHPDFSTATKNAMIASNHVISPITPSEHGYNAKFNLEQRVESLRKEAIDFSTRESYMTADINYIANMVKHNTRSSRDLLEALQDDESVIGIIPDKEMFNRSMIDRVPICKMAQDPKLYQSQHEFFDGLNNTFANIDNTYNHK